MDLGVEIQGDLQIALRFEEFPHRFAVAWERRITALTAQMLARVLGAEPSRTGKLRAETRSFVDVKDDRIRGAVAVVTGGDQSEHGKAGALEYGAHGSVGVAAHSQNLSHIYDRMIQPMQVFVDAYSRHVNITERRFERGTLDSMRSQVIEELRAALADAAAE